MPALLEASPGSSYLDPKLRTAMIESKKSTEEPIVAYVSKMVAIPENELPVNKRRGGALTAEEARELGRQKRAEIARAQALAAEEDTGVDMVTDALSKAAIGEDSDDETEEQEPKQPETKEH